MGDEVDFALPTLIVRPAQLNVWNPSREPRVVLAVQVLVDCWNELAAMIRKFPVRDSIVALELSC